MEILISKAPVMTLSVHLSVNQVTPELSEWGRLPRKFMFLILYING